MDLIIEDKKCKNKKLLIEAKYKINTIISPQGRFKESESKASSILINDSLFLYDDIQFAILDL